MNDAQDEWLGAELLSVRKIAQFLDCSPKTVQDWLYKDRKNPNTDPLPYYRVRGLIRFKLIEVLAWVERRRVRVSSLQNL